ncbi:MAG: hypothetical protein ABSB36_08055 [Candidatus Dormibacteria bacterium]|jgi:hypothetical protein
MNTEWQFAGLRFLDVRDLKGTAILDTDGARLGSVGAVLPRLDGAVDILIDKDTPRGRVFRVALDDVEIDELGRLWRRPGWRVYRVAVPAAAESLTER